MPVSSAQKAIVLSMLTKSFILRPFFFFVLINDASSRFANAFVFLGSIAIIVYIFGLMIEIANVYWKQLLLTTGFVFCACVLIFKKI